MAIYKYNFLSVCFQNSEKHQITGRPELNTGIKTTILILFGIALVMYGVALQLLFFVGKTTYAHIAFNESTFIGRGHPKTYITHYTFTLPDKSMMTGDGYFAVRSGEPRGTIRIRYFSFYPAFNSLSGAGLIVYSLFFISIGLIMLINVLMLVSIIMLLQHIIYCYVNIWKLVENQRLI